jgi:hypothetical protein
LDEKKKEPLDLKKPIKKISELDITANIDDVKSVEISMIESVAARKLKPQNKLAKKASNLEAHDKSSTNLLDKSYSGWDKDYL